MAQCLMPLDSPPRSDQQAEPVVEVVAYLGDGFDAHQEERVREMPGGCAVNSGQPGHSHVYAILSRHGREVLDLPNHQHLCRVVGDWFHATDPKISDNDMMRLPGTWNFKPRAYDPHAAPLPVSWAVHPPEDRPDATRLRQYLRTRKVGPGGSGTAGPAKAVCGEAESSPQAGPWTAITPWGRAPWRGFAVLARWGGRWRVGWLARPSYPR
jgi:hypothetical protein